MRETNKMVYQYRRVLAWVLTFVLVMGNLSQIVSRVVYGAEVQTLASPSNAVKATPSQASKEKEKKVVEVTLTQAFIEKALKKSGDKEQELNENLIPFDGETRDLVAGMLHEELDEALILLQKQEGKAMYLVVADSSDSSPSAEIAGEAFALSSVRIVGVNAYEDRDCEFRLQITGGEVFATDAAMDQYVVVQKQEPKKRLLKSAMTLAATESEGESVPQNSGQDSELVPLGTWSLSSGELAALTGVSGQEYPMLLAPGAITLMDVEFGPMEAEPGPYETALLYYGENAPEKKEVVEISVSQSVTGPIKAGAPYNYNITYTMQASPLYAYPIGGNLSLFDVYENARITFTVPSGVVLQEQEKLHFISSGSNGSLYEISVGTQGSVLPGSSGNITVNAYIDGNGERAVGETFALPVNSVVFYAEVKVADKTDPSNVVYPGNIATVTYGEQPDNTVLSLISDDEWHVRKKVYPDSNSYTVVPGASGKPEYVDITYLIEMGMNGSAGGISTYPDSAAYIHYGRTGFQPGSFGLTDSLSITTPGAPSAMQPISVTATWQDGSPVHMVNNGNGSITIDEFKTNGQNTPGYIYVSDLAPSYSSYLVTARYPYAPFLLKYNDSRIGDSSVFTVNNSVSLKYVKRGTSQVVTENSQANVAVHEVSSPGVLKIKKVIDEGLGSLRNYDLAAETEYSGFAEFEIYSVGSDGSLTAYNNYTVIDRTGQTINSRRILINPSEEAGESGLYVTGNDGLIQVKVDPGTYAVKESTAPGFTEYNSTVIGSDSFTNQNDTRVSLEGGQTKEVTVVNGVRGKGAIAFTKKARTWNTVTASETDLNALQGAVFVLYKVESGVLTEIKTAQSDSSGNVSFQVLSPGSYVVKERSANGYILNTTEYPVTVAADQTVGINSGSNLVVNVLNEAKVGVTKWIQNDSGAYIKVPESYRADFNNKFWFEKSTDGGVTWTQVSVQSQVTYSLDANSQFTVTLPVVDAAQNPILYRIVEEIPEGYDNGNGSDFVQEIRNGKTCVYKLLTLSALGTLSVDVRNKKGAVLKLKKSVWSISAGTLNKNAQSQGRQFLLYASNLDGSGLAEVSPGTVYTTDSSGGITVKGLDIAKQYYWREINSADRLETADTSKMVTIATAEGARPAIGPYRLSRESDTLAEAGNIPQKVPYWIYKVDAVNSGRNITAGFKITKSDGTVVFEGSVSSGGSFVLLDPGTVYDIQEVTPPANYVKAPDVQITTPSGPVTGSLLEQWFEANNTTTRITFENTPYKQLTIKKTQHNANASQDTGIRTPFEYYVKESGSFVKKGDITSNVAAYLAPGTYYFKESVPAGILNPYYLLSDNSQGIHATYEVWGTDVYYGPVIITAATSSQSSADLNLGVGNTPLDNYQDYGSATVTKRDALKNITLNGAVLGIFRADSFNVNDWENSILSPIQTLTTSGSGQVTFNSTALKLFDSTGARISYVIAEITPPVGYLPTRTVLTTELREGRVIANVNGDLTGPALIIENEPKLTIRTQKFWVDDWGYSFYPADHPLGNVELALYEGAADGNAYYIGSQTTNAYDGSVTFGDINRNKTYYVVEVRVPTKAETGLSFDLTMQNKLPLAPGGGTPPALLPLANLEAGMYNSVKYTGNTLNAASSLIQNTESLYNYRSWVQFNIHKVCNQIWASGNSHSQLHGINGAKFSLYVLKDTVSDLSGITLADLSDTSRFEKVGNYQSGTRVDPITGNRASGEFDTTILDAGKVYFLVETEPAQLYADSDMPKITSVFVPDGGSFTGHEAIRHTYHMGRNEQIDQIPNVHLESDTGIGGGLWKYHFQIMLNKWLEHEDTSAEPSPLGGVKFQIWLMDPVTREKVLPIQVMETGLESTAFLHTGYALSEMMNLGELKYRLEQEGLDADTILQVDANDEYVQGLFALEEVWAPAGVELDPTLHYLDITIPKREDYIEDTYFWKTGDPEEYHLLNRGTDRYPVTIQKYGYSPVSETFGKTDEELDQMIFNKTPLAGVQFEIWQYLWNNGAFNYVNVGSFTTDNDGKVEIPSGLEEGQYRLREILTSGQNQDYVTLYNGQNGRFRYFRVDHNGAAVNVYNPEKPRLVIEKTAWDGGIPAVNLEGVRFVIQRSGGSETGALTAAWANGSYRAAFEGLESGVYTIKSEALGVFAGAYVTGEYFETQTVNVGYQVQVSGESVTIEPLDSGVTEKTVYAKVKNPRLSALRLNKIDGETGQSGSELSGAVFTVEYLKFRSGTDLISGVLQDVTGSSYMQPTTGFASAGVSFQDQGNGIYLLDDCKPGWYKITETTAPAGYALSSQPVIVAVVGDMGSGGYVQTTNVTFENTRKTELTITKKLDFGDGFRSDPNIELQLPAAVVFDVYTYSGGSYVPVVNEAGQAVRVTLQNFTLSGGYYTASASVLLSQNPQGGFYYLKEQELQDFVLSSPDPVSNGILFSDGYIQVGAAGDFTTQDPVAVEIRNQYAKAKVRLTKVDRDNHSITLTGASFELYSDSALTGLVGAFAETAQAGIYEIVFSTKLHPPGTYYIKEVNPPAGYRPISVALPSGGLTAQTGMRTDVTVENESGMDLKLTKYSSDGVTEALKPGISFELYWKNGSGPWNYIGEDMTDSLGELEFTGLEFLPGYSYAVREVVPLEQGFAVFRIENFTGSSGSVSPITANVVRNGENLTGVTLYVLADSSTPAGEAYEFTVRNLEARSLQILKNDINPLENPSPGIAAMVKVSDKNTGVQIGNLVSVPYGSQGTSVKLFPGTYIVEEVSITSNTQGYIINQGDVRVISRREVEIEADADPEACTLINLKQKAQIGIGKTSPQQEIKELWHNDNQTVTYTITPAVVNSLPLQRFVIEDTGLQMLNAGGTVLPEADYSRERYTIVSVKPGNAAQDNFVPGASAGMIMADVTFYDFSGNQAGPIQSVAVGGSVAVADIFPVSGTRIKSFQIRYRDDTFAASTGNQYVLGQNFVPGSVNVTINLEQQETELPSGGFKEEIKFVRNNVETDMGYREWNESGVLDSAVSSVQAENHLDIPVVENPAPIMEVKKGASPASSVEPGDTLVYTLSVKNITASTDPVIEPIKRPVLIDLLPPGVTVSGEVWPGTDLLKAVALVNAPPGISIERTIRKVDPLTGRETVLIQLDGELLRGEFINVELTTKLGGNVINFGADVINTLYAGSNVSITPSASNPTGASFMGSGGWPAVVLPGQVQLQDESYRSRRYLTDTAHNTLTADAGMQLFKEVKGNLDTRYVSGNTAGKVAKSADGSVGVTYDGSVLYRLITRNSSLTNYITQFQLMDVLPAEGDYSTGNFQRFSDYRLKYDGLVSIAIENQSNFTPGRKVSGFGYELTFSNQNFNTTAAAAAAKTALLNDNSGGYWINTSADPSAIRLKITDPGFYLAPGENLVVTYKALVPYTTQEELDERAYDYAVNDFATSYSFKANLTDISEIKFSQVQTSNSVQLLLTPGNVEVSGRIWLDDNYDGIQDEGVGTDHFLTDLLPLLQNNYFGISLILYSKNGNDQVAGSVSAADARFGFDHLTPAKPFGITGNIFTDAQEDTWYNNQSLIVSKLKGQDPAHYRLKVTTGTLPAGFGDLILKLTKPTMLSSGTNPKAGRSRLPDTLSLGESNYAESLDSNFSGISGNFTSEDFFLWSTTTGYDETKDIGFAAFRNITIKKTDELGNPVAGTHFTIYGPFTNQEISDFESLGVTSDAQFGAAAAQGTTVLSGGEAVWNAGELLYYRNYVVVEDSAPAGYQIENAQTNDLSALSSYSVSARKAWVLQSKEFETGQNPVPGVINVENSFLTGALQFKKIDGLTGEDLGGAVFRLTKDNSVVEDAWNDFVSAMQANPASMGVKNVNVITNGVEFEVVSGSVTLPNLPYGSFVLSELSVPDGYDVTRKPADMPFSIATEGEEITLPGVIDNRIENYRTEYEFTLNKRDDTGNNQVPNVRFSLSGPGKYENTSWLPFVPPTFTLINPAEDGYEEKVTNSSGRITWNLPYGDYKVEEFAVNGYETVPPFYLRVALNGAISLLNGQGRTDISFVSSSQGSVNVIVTNTVKKGPLWIEKLDGETGRGIAGARFELRGTSIIDGAFSAYRNAVTGLGVSGVTQGVDGAGEWIRFQADGTSSIGTGAGRLTGLPYGNYTLREISAPPGYLYTAGSEWSESFAIDSANGVRFTGNNGILNLPHRLNIEKRDAVTGATLAGAVFTLIDSQGKYISLNQLSYTGTENTLTDRCKFVTGSDGRVTVKRLPSGTYTLREVQAPANYEISAVNTGVTVLASGNPADVVVYDVRNRAKIRLTKTAAHNHQNLLRGAVFDVYSDSALTVLAGTITTGAEGVGESAMLPLGTYYVKERTAPAAYVANPGVYPVVLGNDRETYVLTADGNDFVTNAYATGSLTFDKIDGTSGEALADAVFSLTKKETEAEGSFDAFALLLAGSSQTVLESMGINSLSVSGNVITFALMDGHLSIPGIPYGKYTLKEETAPTGYVSLTGSVRYDFVLTKGKESAAVGSQNVVVNERAQFQLDLRKVNNLGHNVKDVQFEFLGPGKYQSNGILSLFGANSFHAGSGSDRGTFTTNNNGLIRLGLKYGDYQIKELDCGSYEETEPFYIRIDKTGTVTLLRDDSNRVTLTGNALTVLNQISTGQLEMEKVDSENTGLRLDGAKFTLTNLSTQVPGAWEAYRYLLSAANASWTTADVNGNTITFTLEEMGIITNLPYGKYRLTEIQAPAGYILGSSRFSKEFTIDRSNRVVSFTKPALFETTKGAILNEPSELVVEKTDAYVAVAKLKGAEFVLKASDGSFIVCQQSRFSGYTNDQDQATVFVTNQVGRFTIKRLPEDTYTFIETKAPAWHYINENIPPVVLDGIHQFFVTIQDPPKVYPNNPDSNYDAGSRIPKPPLVPGQPPVLIPDPIPEGALPEPGGSDPDLGMTEGKDPTGSLPKTGEKKNGAAKVMVTLSGFMTALYAAFSKKKKEQKDQED